MLDVLSDALVRLDPSLILDEMDFGTPDDWQRRILRSTSRRMLVNCHRQSGKSTTVAGLALHTAIYNPSSLIVIVSAGQRQSDELLRKVVAGYETIGRPVPTVEDNSATLALANGSRVVSLPNNEKTIRGYSDPVLVLADEASRIDPPVFAAIRPMLAVSQGRLILLSTPHGRQGEFYRMWSGGDPAWERIELKGEDNPRISREYLAQEKRDMIAWQYRQEWEASFEDTEDQVISGEDIAAAFCSEEKPFFSTEELYG
jgi:hypothetical protein